MTGDLLEKLFVKVSKIGMERKKKIHPLSLASQSHSLSSLICSALARLRKLMSVYSSLLCCFYGAYYGKNMLLITYNKQL